MLRHYLPETTLADYMYQERRKEEDLPALKIGLTHRYDYIGKHKGGLITAIKNDTDITITNSMTITMKQKWEEKQLYVRFKQLINNISHEKTKTWLRKINFERETDSFLIAAQNNTIRTNHVKARIDMT